MTTARYSSNSLADGGAFPVSLRALLRTSIQEQRVPESRSKGRAVGGIVFDGGSFPHRLSRSLNRLRGRSRTGSRVESPKPSTQGQEAGRWKRLEAVPIEALEHDRMHELNIIEAEVIHISQMPVAQDSQ